MGTLREKGIFAEKKKTAFSFAKKAFLQAKKGHGCSEKGYGGSEKDMAPQKKGMVPQKRAWRSVMLNIPGGIAMEDDPSQNKYKKIAPVKALYFSNITMTSYVVCIQ